MYWVTLATYYLLLFLLHCYSRVGSIFTIVSTWDYSVKQLLLRWLRSIGTTKLRVKIVVPKLHKSILPVKRKDIQLEPCIAPSLPFSPLLLKTASQSLSLPTAVNFVTKNFKDFTKLGQHKNTPHGSPMNAANVEPYNINNEVDDPNLEEELRSCKCFLVDFELEKAKHKVMNYAVENLNETLVSDKLDHFFNNLKSAAKMNIAFGFTLKILEDGGFWNFYAHKNITRPDLSKLVCTKDDLTKLKVFSTKLMSLSRVVKKRWTQYGFSAT